MKGDGRIVQPGQHQSRHELFDGRNCQERSDGAHPVKVKEGGLTDCSDVRNNDASAVTPRPWTGRQTLTSEKVKVAENGARWRGLLAGRQFIVSNV